MKKTLTTILNILLVCMIAISATGCTKVQASDLMEGIEAKDPASIPPLEDDSIQKAADFAVRLFQATQEEGKNRLISPLSVFSVLAMCLNGAKKETLAQMEKTLGFTVEECNAFYQAYRNVLQNTEKCHLNPANAIWFTADGSFKVNRDFLQTNADVYKADAYMAPFDETTVKDINNWVKEKTEGMINNILDQIPSEAVMYLVNALAFEAEWEVIYTKDQVRKGDFTLENGTKKNCDFMYSTEKRYVSLDKAQGFIKYYADDRYAFAALLPDEGVSVSDLVASLDGKTLQKALADPSFEDVKVCIPKFETEYSVGLNDALKAMGMPLAFDEDHADLSGLGYSGKGNLFISRVLHKTYINVDEKGTKAGAATVVEISNKAVFMPPEKEVYLNRPFVYMLIDTQTWIPFFIGTLMETGK